ncbi:MAG: hypothetical protein R3Y35_02440 [Clostridia bacterium]
MDEILVLAISKLSSLGYSDIDSDDLDFYANKSYQEIKNRLGSDDVPLALNYVIADMVAGFYLQDLLLQSDENGAVSAIKEGDISVSYESGKSFLDQIQQMVKPSEAVLSRFRRIVW